MTDNTMLRSEIYVKLLADRLIDRIAHEYGMLFHKVGVVHQRKGSDKSLSTLAMDAGAGARAFRVQPTNWFHCGAIDAMSDTRVPDKRPATSASQASD